MYDRIMRVLAVVGITMFMAVPALSQAEVPWGKAALEEIDYAPQRVVYDVAEGDLERFDRILDRVSFLNNVYGADPFDASIVLVLHGDEIGFFAIENYGEYGELMRRAQSLTLAGPIQFRMCQAAAHERGFAPEDIHGFVEIVPMADAEIIRLQQEEGHAFMQ
jgi:intracellular sulfur oxidation DsrE/DsrF family protein